MKPNPWLGAVKFI